MPYKDPEDRRNYEKRKRESDPEWWERRLQKRRASIRAWEQRKRQEDPQWVEAKRQKAREGPKCERDPNKQRCRRKVQSRVRHHKMPHASVFTCADCSAKAQEYHHESYESWWAITALCKPCHGKRHRKHDDD